MDGPNAAYMSSSVLDRWEERLYDIFNGRPFDMLDAALSDTVHNFPLDIKVIFFQVFLDLSSVFQNLKYN